MNTKNTILSALLILSNALFAQEKPVSVGIITGLGASNGMVSSEHEEHNQYKGISTYGWKFDIGFQTSFELKSANRIYTGLSYYSFGDKSNFYNADISRGLFTSHQFKSRFNAIGISVFYRHYLSKNFIDFGSKAGFIFNDKLYLNMNSESPLFSEQNGVLVSDWNFSCLLGVGREVYVLNKKLNFIIRANIATPPNSINLPFGNKLPNRTFTSIAFYLDYDF